MSSFNVRYDHVSDDMVREYFEKQKLKNQTINIIEEKKQEQKFEIGYN